MLSNPNGSGNSGNLSINRTNSPGNIESLTDGWSARIGGYVLIRRPEIIVANPCRLIEFFKILMGRAQAHLSIQTSARCALDEAARNRADLAGQRIGLEKRITE